MFVAKWHLLLTRFHIRTYQQNQHRYMNQPTHSNTILMKVEYVFRGPWYSEESKQFQLFNSKICHCSPYFYLAVAICYFRQLYHVWVYACVCVLWVEIITEWKLSYLIHHIRQIHVYKCLSTKDQYEWEWLENIRIVIKCVY